MNSDLDEARESWERIERDQEERLEYEGRFGECVFPRGNE